MLITPTIFFNVIVNDCTGILVQSTFNLYSEVNIGGAKIRKPSDWVMYYEKKDSDRNGYLYGLIPIPTFEKTTGNNVTYTFRNTINGKNEIVFSKLSYEYSITVKKELSRPRNHSNSKLFNTFIMNGYEALGQKMSYDKSGYSVAIPELSLFAIVNSIDDIREFYFFKN